MHNMASQPFVHHTTFGKAPITSILPPAQFTSALLMNLTLRSAGRRRRQSRNVPDSPGECTYIHFTHTHAYTYIYIYMFLCNT